MPQEFSVLHTTETFSLNAGDIVIWKKLPQRPRL